MLKNGEFVIEGRVLPGDLYIRDGLIERFAVRGEQGDVPSDSTSYTVLDCKGALVGPGFIDLHVHGGGGADVMDASCEAFEKMAATHANYGTTRFLLTTVTASHEEILEVCHKYTEWKKKLPFIQEQTAIHGIADFVKSDSVSGALPLGIHLEGPYIAVERKGAQNEAHIRPFSMKEFTAYQQAATGGIKMITLAPEKLTHPEMITRLCRQGVLVSIGHTEANYEQTREAFRLGASHVTHLCNAMNTIHHREPGPIVFALETDGISTEFIADGIHVHPAMIRLALRAKRNQEIAVITDAISATDLGNGDYHLGGLPIVVKNNTAVLADGTLAGSCLTMERAYRFLHEHITSDPALLFQMMSTTPARILGIQQYFGSIAAGKVADLVIFRGNRVTGVMVAGCWVKGGTRNSAN